VEGTNGDGIAAELVVSLSALVVLIGMVSTVVVAFVSDTR
jgi:hypothetical protein